ncbi:F0F1 ATP synthase subunit B [Patescibacteria group bacterium]|nr:F0F1 ATP synthase subunit B [Patescibacteria group bacterium]MBU4455321.1 F0F1 ATP synthase subunit B [Patescibacteria group bacterium]MCG2690592.1 F0F1 ATP synthase subunit B [Candidatus Parcubacteria bacterium]
MDSLIETFHIDVKLLIAQIINFAIVFSVLYFFALKPLLKVMGERTKKIEKSIDDAEKIEEKLARSEEEYKKEIIRARKEAEIILEKAGQRAEERKQETIANAKEEIGQIINQEKAKIQQEKAKTLKEIKKEVADLVVASVEKVLSEKVDNQKDGELIKKMVKR